MKHRNDEIQMLRKDLREREELIQQREIDISCLRGQVNRALEQMEEEDSDTLTYECDSQEEEMLLTDIESEPNM